MAGYKHKQRRAIPYTKKEKKRPKLRGVGQRRNNYRGGN